MHDRAPARLELGRLLAAVEAAPPVAAADVVADLLAETVGASEVAFLIADLSGDSLVRLGHTDATPSRPSYGRETAEHVPILGSPHGRALAAQQPEVDGCEVFAPVTNRGEAIGVLELTLPTPPDEQALADVRLAAHALAYVIVANRRFTDLFEWGRRSVPLSLAAEIQHRLLPAAYTCEAGQFTLAAWLEPAGDIAGDTFDYSVDRDTLHLSMTDAMGHGVEAAMLATVLVGALRNGRRRGQSVTEQACHASEALATYVSSTQFVTGQLLRIDLQAETAEAVNAGHPPPLRLRAGEVAEVPLAPDLPFGTGGAHQYESQVVSLEPGDRLVFMTDGMLERNAAGVDLATHVRAGAHLHPREAVQMLVREVLAATGGKLEDDATVLCLDWHGSR